MRVGISCRVVGRRDNYSLVVLPVLKAVTVYVLALVSSFLVGGCFDGSEGAYDA